MRCQEIEATMAIILANSIWTYWIGLPDMEYEQTPLKPVAVKVVPKIRISSNSQALSFKSNLLFCICCQVIKMLLLIFVSFIYFCLKSNLVTLCERAVALLVSGEQTLRGFEWLRSVVENVLNCTYKCRNDVAEQQQPECEYQMPVNAKVILLQARTGCSSARHLQVHPWSTAGIVIVLRPWACGDTADAKTFLFSYYCYCHWFNHETLNQEGCHRLS